MMIGIDLVDVSRIARVIKKHGNRFLDKVFTEEEIQYVKGMKRMHESLAGRFAAKEAFMKAFGKRLVWKDIKVLQVKGKPFIHFHGKDYQGVSISHEQSYAVSVVVIYGSHSGNE
jgi:holo-[acyl-carrier-protein] synthase